MDFKSTVIFLSLCNSFLLTAMDNDHFQHNLNANEIPSLEQLSKLAGSPVKSSPKKRLSHMMTHFQDWESEVTQERYSLPASGGQPACAEQRAPSPFLEYGQNPAGHELYYQVDDVMFTHTQRTIQTSELSTVPENGDGVHTSRQLATTVAYTTMARRRKTHMLAAAAPSTNLPELPRKMAKRQAEVVACAQPSLTPQAANTENCPVCLQGLPGNECGCPFEARLATHVVSTPCVDKLRAVFCGNCVPEAEQNASNVHFCKQKYACIIDKLKNFLGTQNLSGLPTLSPASAVQETKDFNPDSFIAGLFDEPQEALKNIPAPGDEVVATTHATPEQVHQEIRKNCPLCLWPTHSVKKQPKEVSEGIVLILPVVLFLKTLNVIDAQR